jgi:hypothetical protein
MRVDAFRSEIVVLSIKANGSRHKILQLLFGSDGSLYVTFPYFKHSEGILAVATIPAGVSRTDINLAHAGKVSSHRVKYSHHPRGQAHFSQSGKVKTEIKRQSVALAEQEGHIFTVLLKRLRCFERTNEKSDAASTPKRTTLTFEIPERADSFRVVGRWYWIEDLVAEPRPRVVGPIVSTKRPDGTVQNAFIVANPASRAEHVLLLTCEVDHAISADPEFLGFYGGFDPPSAILDTTKPTSFLAFIYPATDFVALKNRIGSIDLTPGKPPGGISVIKNNVSGAKRPR